MDEDKLKKAFQRIKHDMGKLSQDVTSLKIEIARNEMNKSVRGDSSKDLEKKLNNFVKNSEEEFKKLNFAIKELEDSTSHNSKRQDQLEFQYLKLKKSNEKIFLDIEKNYLDVSSVEERFLEFTELINEKIDLEMGSLRLEFIDEIAKVYDSIYSNEDDGKKKPIQTETGKKKTPPKITKEVPEKKKAKVVDGEGVGNKKIENIVYEEEDNKKPSKVKKVLKWLFLDEDEEDYNIDEVKKEVKTSGASKKK